MQIFRLTGVARTSSVPCGSIDMHVLAPTNCLVGAHHLCDHHTSSTTCGVLLTINNSAVALDQIEEPRLMILLLAAYCNGEDCSSNESCWLSR